MSFLQHCLNYKGSSRSVLMRAFRRFISWQQLSSGSFAVTSISFRQLYLPTRNLCTFCVVQRYIREVTSNSKDSKTAKIYKKDRFRADWGIGGMGIARVLLFLKKCVNHDVWRLWVVLVFAIHYLTKKEMKSSQNFLSNISLRAKTESSRHARLTTINRRSMHKECYYRHEKASQ